MKSTDGYNRTALSVWFVLLPLGSLAGRDPAATQFAHHPDNIHFPASLGFTDAGVQGVAITVMQAPTQQPLPFKMDDYGARTAAIEILRHFGVEFDADTLP